MFMKLSQSQPEIQIGEGMLTLQEVASFLKLDVRTVRALPLRPVRLGRQFRYDRRDIERLIEQSKITAPHHTNLPKGLK
jgi:hypothetical protein